MYNKIITTYEMQCSAELLFWKQENKCGYNMVYIILVIYSGHSCQYWLTDLTNMMMITIINIFCYSMLYYFVSHHFTITTDTIVLVMLGTQKMSFVKPSSQIPKRNL